MEKNKINNIENNYQITNKEEHSEHKSKGIYIRDDHCDWGSSGMNEFTDCLLYTSPSPRDRVLSRMPSSA